MINLVKQKVNKCVGAGSKPVYKNKHKSKFARKKKKNMGRVIKCTSLIILSIGALTMFLLSDLFNIKQIKVVNNNKISAQEIINLSGLKIDENMFKFLKIKVTESIKTNPYVESVNVHRKLERNSRNRNKRKNSNIYVANR